MDIKLIISIVAILISVIALCVNIFILLQSIRTNNNNVSSMKADANMSIIKAHRELFAMIVQNDELLKIISSNNVTVDEARRRYIGTMLINHCESIYTYAQNRYISNDDWCGTQNDIREMFSWEVVINRWKEIRGYYTIDFQNFIDSLVINGRMDVLNKKTKGIG